MAMENDKYQEYHRQKKLEQKANSETGKWLPSKSIVRSGDAFAYMWEEILSQVPRYG